MSFLFDHELRKKKLQKKMFDGAEPTESAQCCIINIGFRLLSYLHTTIALTHVSRAEKLPKNHSNQQNFDTDYFA